MLGEPDFRDDQGLGKGGQDSVWEPGPAFKDCDPGRAVWPHGAPRLALTCPPGAAPPYLSWFWRRRSWWQSGGGLDLAEISDGCGWPLSPRPLCGPLHSPRPASPEPRVSGHLASLPACLLSPPSGPRTLLTLDSWQPLGPALGGGAGGGNGLRAGVHLLVLPRSLELRIPVNPKLQTTSHACPAPVARCLCRPASACRGWSSAVPGAGLLAEWDSRQLGPIPLFFSTDRLRGGSGLPGGWHCRPPAASAWGSHPPARVRARSEPLPSRPLGSYSLCVHGNDPASGATRVRHRSLVKLTSVSLHPQRGVRGHLPSTTFRLRAAPQSPVPEGPVLRSVSTAGPPCPRACRLPAAHNQGGQRLGRPFNRPAKPAKAGAPPGCQRPGGAAIFIVTEETSPRVPTDRSIYIFIFIHIILN